MEKIKARSPSYVLANGLGVEDSEEKIKQALGEDFDLSRSPREDYLAYEDKGVALVVQREDKTVIEIVVFPARPKATPSPCSTSYSPTERTN